ncbi:hypothetical protein RsTz2092_03040 [Deferribacterales bacterium RsTz2092]|nr:hypothetical protein AGMMS49941_07900 [Deferribacterales bacterium]
MKRYRAIMSAVLLSLICFACGDSGKGGGGKDVKAIVEINGRAYTVSDLWNYSSATIWEIGASDMNNTSVKNAISQGFVEHKLLLEEAERRGITTRHDDHQNKLSQQLLTAQGAKELRAITGRYDINANELAKLAEERLIVDELVRNITLNIGNITEEELRKLYESKTKGVPVGNVARIRHIFTTDKIKAQKVIEELGAGITFSEVARKYSDGAEKTDGGDLGFIRESNYPEFFVAAFKLSPGAVSRIVESEYGYHIFRMDERADVTRTSFANMKPLLIAELYTVKRQSMMEDFINALRSKADIRYLDDFNFNEFLSATKSKR